MNRSIKQTIECYHIMCENIANLFADRYFEKGAFLHNIGREFDGVWNVNDYYFNLSDMALALELDMEWKALEAWYDQWTDTDETKIRVNMRSYKYLISEKLTK